jgi:putative DNA primase/helicase
VRPGDIIVGDLCRRVITATLNPGVEQPELREFRGDPVATVMADRGK